MAQCAASASAVARSFVLSDDAACPPLADFEQLLQLEYEGASLKENIDQLDGMMQWCRRLFLEHDRALISCTLYECIQAKLDVLFARASARGDAAATQQYDVVSSILSSDPFPLIRRVKSELGELQRSCGAPSIDSSWTVLDDGLSGARIATYYRSESGSGTHSFLVSGLVAAPMLNLVCMLKEAQLLSQWIPAVSESTLLAPLHNSRYRMLLRVTLKLFWPIANREAMLYGYGDMLHDSVGIFFRSTRDQGADAEKVFARAGPPTPGGDGTPSDVCVPAVAKGAVRVKVKTGGFWFTPQPNAPGVTRVRALFNVDPRFAAIPKWFLNTMSKEFCAVIIELLREKAPKLFANPHSPYSQALVQQKRTYDQLRQRLDEVAKAAAEDAEQANTSDVAAGAQAATAAHAATAVAVQSG